MNVSTERTRWTPDIIKRAQVLKAEGLSFSRIGRRLGVSKNSILSAYKRYVEGNPLCGYKAQRHNNHLCGVSMFAPSGPVPTLAFVRGLERNPRYKMMEGVR